MASLGAGWCAVHRRSGNRSQSGGSTTSMDRARSRHRRAKPQNSAAAAGNRKTTCQCAFCTCGRVARQDGLIGDVGLVMFRAADEAVERQSHGISNDLAARLVGMIKWK